MWIKISEIHPIVGNKILVYWNNYVFSAVVHKQKGIIIDDLFDLFDDYGVLPLNKDNEICKDGYWCEHPSLKDIEKEYIHLKKYLTAVNDQIKRIYEKD
jgi:hypothetical protein